MTKKSVKKIAKKRSWSKAHGVIIGAGLISSAYLATTLSASGFMNVPRNVAAVASSITHANGQLTSATPSPSGFDLSVSSANFGADKKFAYYVSSTTPHELANVMVRFEWLTFQGGLVIKTATGTDWIGWNTSGLKHNPVIGFEPNHVPESFFVPPATGAQLRITIDPNNTIAETQERNNQFILPIWSDLRINNATISPDGNLSFVVVNNGPATIPFYRLTLQNTNGTTSSKVGYEKSIEIVTPIAPYSAVVYDNNTPRGAQLNALLHQYQYGARGVRVKIAPQGVYKSTAYIEQTDVHLLFPIPKFEIVQAAYTLGSNLVYSVKNVGGWAADRPTMTVSWTNSLKTLKNCESGSRGCPAFAAGSVLKPGETKEFTLGSKTAFMVGRPLNASRLQISVRGGNNQQSINPISPTLLTWPLPELQPTSASFTGLNKAFHYSIGNSGTASASGFKVGLRWKKSDGTYIGVASQFAIPEIPVGGTVSDPGLNSAQATYFFTVIPPGANKLELVIDPDNISAEQGALNNRIEVPYN